MSILLKVSKREYHSVTAIFEPIEITMEEMVENFPEKTEEEILEMIEEAKNDESALSDLISNLEDNYAIDWEREYDDWVSDRKGGYDIDYFVED